MRRTFVTVLAGALLSLQALAAPASEASIERLLTLTRSESMIDSMYATLEPMMRQMSKQAVGEQALTDQDRRVMDAMFGASMRVMREELSWARMKPNFVTIYRDTFDQEEIEGLIAFYASPVGQSFVNKMPVVMQKSMTTTQAMMGPVMQKMRAAMEQAMADAKAGK